MTIATATVGTSPAAVYTSGGNTAVTFLSLCNYSASAVSINVYVVPLGFTAGTTNIVYSNLQLTANDTYQLYLGGEKLLLSTGDTIQVSAGTASSVTAVTSYTSI